MAQGWIKLHRTLNDNPLWLSEEFTKGQAWVDILLRINHQDGKVMIGNTPVEVKAGQTLWSTKDMSERWKWSRKKVVNFLNMLKKEHQLDFESTTKYTVLTVENWALYQDENEKGTSKDEKGNNKGTSKAHQRNTNKNDKKEKNDKNIFLSDSNEYRLADYLRKYILKNNPNARVPDENKLQGWCKAIDLMIRIDKRTVEEIKSNIHFAQTDSFWKNNILSADSLRSKFDQLTGKAQQNNKTLIPKKEQVTPKCKMV